MNRPIVNSGSNVFTFTVHPKRPSSGAGPQTPKTLTTACQFWQAGVTPRHIRRPGRTSTPRGNPHPLHATWVRRSAELLKTIATHLNLLG